MTKGLQKNFKDGEETGNQFAVTSSQSAMPTANCQLQTANLDRPGINQITLYLRFPRCWWFYPHLPRHDNERMHHYWNVQPI